MSENNAELATLLSSGSAYPPDLEPHTRLDTVSNVPDIAQSFAIILIEHFRCLG